MAKWKACVAADRYRKQVVADQELAASANARATPNTYVNGRKLLGARPLEDFKQVIDEELTKAKAMVARGVKADKVYDEVIKR